MNTRAQALTALASLTNFIGPVQRSVLSSYMLGEEGQFFIDMVCNLFDTIQQMPHTYQQQGKGDKAIVTLHYFVGGQANFWITEKDMNGEQIQDFGLADLFGDGGELGYISLPELLENGAELDLYFTPKPLVDVNQRGRTGRIVR